jgi:DNA-binding beta-propeller fold protein YncE/mono/diheme cytochrome c family protein
MSMTFRNAKRLPLLALVTVFAPQAHAQVNLDTYAERGKELFLAPASCSVCHKQDGTGLIGPDITYGPTAAQIFEQLQNNPQMAAIAQELKADNEELIALSVYIRTLGRLDMNENMIVDQRTQLVAARARTETDLVFPKTARDEAVEEIQTWDSVISDWQRRSTEGSIFKSYDSRVVATFDPGKPKFRPKKGKTYFYENVGNSANLAILEPGAKNAKSTQIVVGDAKTHKVIASYELPVSLRAAVHTTVMSPDGKYVYIVGSKPQTEPTNQIKALDAPATLIKADAVTLQPIKQITMGGRLHHGMVFRDRYVLLDTFSRDPDGLDVMLLDPETDEIVGGVRDEDLGGSSYTAYTDDDYIYILMEPVGYASHRSTGMAGAKNLYSGKITTMKPFWVAKVDPDTWEVVREYPYPGFRGDWVVIDAKKENMYVTAGGTSNVSKINLESGEVVWAAGAGISPYGASLNADETEIWIANKGEHTGHFGRTLSVLAADSGRQIATLFTGYEVDHVLLAPNGKEMWATSNGEGRIYVYDTASHKQISVIQMPQNGDPHGLVWVHYDQEGNSNVVRDQGSFRGGVNPALGKKLDY